MLWYPSIHIILSSIYSEKITGPNDELLMRPPVRLCGVCHLERVPHDSSGLFHSLYDMTIMVINKWFWHIQTKIKMRLVTDDHTNLRFFIISKNISNQYVNIFIHWILKKNHADNTVQQLISENEFQFNCSTLKCYTHSTDTYVQVWQFENKC